jgi:hypothetical protein
MRQVVDPNLVMSMHGEQAVYCLEDAFFGSAGRRGAFEHGSLAGRGIDRYQVRKRAADVDSDAQNSDLPNA